MNTYWNGERCEATQVRVVVADAPAHSAYWARQLIGQERDAVKVVYNGGTFYLDDENDAGWHKVTKGMGGPRWGHRSLAVSQVWPRKWSDGVKPVEP